MENLNINDMLADIANSVTTADVEACQRSVTTVEEQSEVSHWRMFAHNEENKENK